MYACVQMIHGFLPILRLAGVVTLSCRGFALLFVHAVPQGSSIIECAFKFFSKYFISSNDYLHILKSFLSQDPISSPSVSIA